MYAIIKTGGKQYTVKPGDVIDVEKIQGEAGDTVDLEVLFANDGTNVITDPAKLADFTVTAEIVEQHRGDKVIVFKFKKRKGYKRTKGHRQQLTKLRITAVGGEKAPEVEKPAKAEKPAEPEVVEEAAEVVEEAPVAAAPAAEAAEDLSGMTVAQLKELAKERDIKLPSSARKSEIIEIIQNA